MKKTVPCGTVFCVWRGDEEKHLPPTRRTLFLWGWGRTGDAPRKGRCP